MLKTVKVTFKITDEPKREIIKTFNKINQKFGAIEICGEVFNDVNLLIELLNITKRYNNKITIIIDGVILFELINSNYIHLNLLFEQIDILGLTLNHLEINLDQYQKIINYARIFNCTINIMTSLTKEVKTTDFTNVLDKLTYNHWIIDALNDDDYHTFINLNKLEHKREISNYYVIPNGLFLNMDAKIISSINKSSKDIFRDLLKYNRNLKLQITNSVFPHQIDEEYLEKITKKIKSGKAAFFDIEAVSRESTNSQKHNLKDYPIPILFALLKIDFKTLKVVDRFSYSVTDVTNLHTIYLTFLNYVKENQIEYLVVSNGELEKRFIENCIFYLKNKLKLEDFRYLFKLKDNLIDIQKVIEKQMNSFKLLQELENFYPDIITFTRKTTKLSFKINFLLDGLIFGPKHHEDEIKKIIDYCFEDVYADFELFKFYDTIFNHNL